MSMAATKEDMATIKLTAREDSPKIMVCQDEKYRIMGNVLINISNLGFTNSILH